MGQRVRQLIKYRRKNCKVTEIKMLRLTLDVIIIEKVRNEYIKGSLEIQNRGQKKKEGD